MYIDQFKLLLQEMSHHAHQQTVNLIKAMPCGCPLAIRSEETGHLIAYKAGDGCDEMCNRCKQLRELGDE